MSLFDPIYRDILSRIHPIRKNYVPKTLYGWTRAFVDAYPYKGDVYVCGINGEGYLEVRSGFSDVIVARSTAPVGAMVRGPYGIRSSNGLNLFYCYSDGASTPALNVDYINVDTGTVTNLYTTTGIDPADSIYLVRQRYGYDRFLIVKCIRSSPTVQVVSASKFSPVYPFTVASITGSANVYNLDVHPVFVTFGNGGAGTVDVRIRLSNASGSAQADTGFAGIGGVWTPVYAYDSFVYLAMLPVNITLTSSGWSFYQSGALWSSSVRTVTVMPIQEDIFASGDYCFYIAITRTLSGSQYTYKISLIEQAPTGHKIITVTDAFSHSSSSGEYPEEERTTPPESLSPGSSTLGYDNEWAFIGGHELFYVEPFRFVEVF